MSKRIFNAIGVSGQRVNIERDDIDENSILVREIVPTKPLSLSDQAFVETINRRILAGASRPRDVMTVEEGEHLEAIGVEIKIEFEKVKKAFTTTLADDMVFSTDKNSLLESKLEKYVRAKIRGTRKFVLTESAAVKVGEAIHNYPEMLVEQGVFARTPFESCWIEFPSRAFHEAVVPGSASQESDERVGYLFDGDRVYICAQSGDGIGAISPLVIDLHTPMTMRKQLDVAEELSLTRYQLDNFYWGQTMADALPSDIRRGLRSQHSFSMKVAEKYRGKIAGDEFLRFTAGEVRNIIGILLMINQPGSVLKTQEIGHQRMMTKKGSRVLMGHSVVTLNLDGRSRPDRLLRAPRGHHAAPRWHEVRNHWCNDRVARTKGYSLDDPKTHGRGNHAHQWVQDDNGELRFTCSVCGGRRWRRVMKNGRGDKSRGIISQDRIVKTSEDQVYDEIY